MSDLKLCKDCKWCDEREGESLAETHFCLFVGKINLITGMPIGEHYSRSCFEERYNNEENICGKEGKYWEAKDA